MKVISELASWFRKLDATSASLFTLVFAAGALFRFPEIKSAVAAQEPTWWLGLVEPVGWAAIAVALRALGVQTVVVRLRMALSPKYRFRQLAPHADALAAELSDGRNYYPFFFSLEEEELPSLSPRNARPQLETAIATFKADLDALGVRRTPPINDVNGWKRTVPELKARMRVGALAFSRNHDWTCHGAVARGGAPQPPPTPSTSTTRRPGAEYGPYHRSE